MIDVARALPEYSEELRKFTRLWHDVIGEPTFADAILDRIVHNAHRINLDGPSMRKTIAENFNANDVDHAERK